MHEERTNNANRVCERTRLLIPLAIDGREWDQCDEFFVHVDSGIRLRFIVRACRALTQQKDVPNCHFPYPTASWTIDTQQTNLSR